MRAFQSTLLMRGATLAQRRNSSDDVISIHAPHARSDLPHSWNRSAAYFLFQSTLLMRGATASAAFDKTTIKISIHAPHARSDKVLSVELDEQENFNPRSSCEERRESQDTAAIAQTISIHAPHARSDAR